MDHVKFRYGITEDLSGHGSKGSQEHMWGQTPPNIGHRNIQRTVMRCQVRFVNLRMSTNTKTCTAAFRHVITIVNL